VVCGEQELSYAELERRANRLARWLRRQGVGVETRVGVLLQREVELVVSLLAVLKAGGAYVRWIRSNRRNGCGSWWRILTPGCC
jgi:non-ribosomal peptide synthetase component F